MPDVGLVHRVKDIKANKTVVCDATADLNMLTCVSLEQINNGLTNSKQPLLVSCVLTADFDASRALRQLPPGCIGIVVDCGYIPAHREHVDVFNDFQMPERLKEPQMTQVPACFKFSKITELKRATSLPIIVRGIQSADDAKKAVDAGA